MHHSLCYLYGGSRPWDATAWVESSDRVRGGSSEANLEVGGSGTARFYGTLDTTTLGGAGFASQHSRGVIDLDLSAYDGIAIAVKSSTDGKRYALTLKDCLLPNRDDGREQSTISWQAEFVTSSAGHVFLSWKAFKPTYRGRDKTGAPPLDIAGIKRIGLMMRSFFDKQYGSFSLEIESIAAYRNTDSIREHQDDDEVTLQGHDEDGHNSKTSGQACEQEKPARRPRAWRRLFCGLL